MKQASKGHMDERKQKYREKELIQKERKDKQRQENNTRSSSLIFIRKLLAEFKSCHLFVSNKPRATPTVNKGTGHCHRITGLRMFLLGVFAKITQVMAITSHHGSGVLPFPCRCNT